MEIKETKELAIEAVELINEYGELSIERRGGENPIVQVRCSDDGNLLFIQELYDREREYKLSNISKIFESEIRFGELDKDFESLRKAYDIQTKFEKMKKDDFITYMGSTYYGQLRCKQIYKRLEKISEIASQK